MAFRILANQDSSAGKTLAACDLPMRLRPGTSAIDAGEPVDVLDLRSEAASRFGKIAWAVHVQEPIGSPLGASEPHGFRETEQRPPAGIEIGRKPIQRFGAPERTGRVKVGTGGGDGGKPGANRRMKARPEVGRQEGHIAGYGEGEAASCLSRRLQCRLETGQRTPNGGIIDQYGHPRTRHLLRLAQREAQVVRPQAAQAQDPINQPLPAKHPERLVTADPAPFAPGENDDERGGHRRSSFAPAVSPNSGAIQMTVV